MPDTTATPATPFPSNIEIAQRAQMRPIVPLARERLGIPDESLEPYGHYKAKVSLDYVAQLADRPDGKLVLVTAISPTPAGEGKTTTTVGLGDALNLIGKRAMLCLREPALHRHETLETRGIGGDCVVDVQPRQVEQPGEPGHHEHHV